MSMFSAFDVTASGLTAQRLRMDVISENVANANIAKYFVYFIILFF